MKLSVIIPVYGVEEYVYDLITSVVTQTIKLEEMEIIVIDDHSKDSSIQIIEENFSGKVKIIKPPQNIGLGAARNFGLSVATGEYVVFIDSDDYVPVNAFKKMVDTAERENADIVIGDYVRFNSTYEKPSFYTNIFDIERKGNYTHFPELVHELTAWNKLFKKSFLDEINFKWDENYLYEDMYPTFRALNLAKMIVIIPDIVFKWRIREHSFSITQRKFEYKNFNDRLEALEKMLNFQEKIGTINFQLEERIIMDISYYIYELPYVDGNFVNLFNIRAKEILSRLSPESFLNFKNGRELVSYNEKRRYTMVKKLLNSDFNITNQKINQFVFVFDYYKIDKISDKLFDQIYNLSKNYDSNNRYCFIFNDNMIAEFKKVNFKNVEFYSKFSEIEDLFGNFVTKLDEHTILLPRKIHNLDIIVKNNFVELIKYNLSHTRVRSVINSNSVTKKEIVKLQKELSSPYINYFVLCSEENTKYETFEELYRKNINTEEVRVFSYVDKLTTKQFNSSIIMKQKIIDVAALVPRPKKISKTSKKSIDLKEYICVESFNGRIVGGNPFYLGKYFSKELKIPLVVSTNYNFHDIENNIIYIKRWEYNIEKIINNATYVFSNNDIWVKNFNPKGTFIQTWHGTPMKKIGRDIDDYSGIIKYINRFESQLQKSKILLAQNEYSKEIFQRSFNYSGEIMVSGYPQNDFFYNLKTEDIVSLKRKFAVSGYDKIILYAPTWRDNTVIKTESNNIRYYSPKIDYDEISKRLPIDSVLIVKLHDNEKKYSMNFKSYGNIKFLPNVLLNELMAISDMLITDYSSIYFDYMVTRKKIIFYAPDLADYKQNARDLYFNFEEQNLPGNIVEDINSLYEEIKNTEISDIQKYNKIFEKYVSHDDGDVCRRIFDYITKK